MMLLSRIIVVGSLAFIAGCAARHTGQRPSAAVTTSAATQPASARAKLKLEEITPAVRLPTTAPATQPTRRPPLNSIELYAKARWELHANRRFSAIAALEEAIKVDPESYELHYLLGRAYLGGGTANDDALRAFEQAAELEPNHLQIQIELGRQYFAREKYLQALHHLRLALQTSDYATDEAGAAVADFFLARTLQEMDYDRAALDQYEKLLKRLEYPTMAMRVNTDIAYLAGRPELLYMQIGELYENNGRMEDALGSFDMAAEEDAGNFELQARPVRTLLSMERYAQAQSRAADIVRFFRANKDSLELLRETYAAQGRASDAIDELKEIYRQQPSDRAMLFALADALRSEGRQPEAEQLLHQATLVYPKDLSIVQRLFKLYDSRGDTHSAARLLIEALARSPEMTRELSALWEELLSPSRSNRLRLPALQKVEVSSDAQAAKLYWISRLADLWNRDSLAHSSLAQAVKYDPPFAPAYRILAQRIWAKPDLQDADKSAQVEAMASELSESGHAALAAELRGLNYLQQKQPDQATAWFAEAQKQGGNSPELQLAQSHVMRLQGQHSKAEQLLWRLISDFPGAEDAYSALFRLYLDQGSMNQAMKVLNTWLAADPSSTSARILQASVYYQAGRGDAAISLVDKLFDDHPENGEVVAALETLYVQQNRVAALVSKLEEHRKQNPTNYQAVEHLVRIYNAQGRAAEATRVLDETRKAVAQDPELLYYLSSIYHRIGKKDQGQQVLEQVLKLDPNHAPASNDLGYFWADEGKHLDRSEALIRVAVEEEPDNQAYLDSLGWVLYKRGKFDEAREFIDRALAPATRPDPVVLDHMGDILYRLNRSDEAMRYWNRSLERLNETFSEREELKTLRLQLNQKLDQHKKGQPVNVAPIVETADKAHQAKGE